ncbi:MAG TPA: hypothetical protein VHC00_04115 [Rhizobiaceae bacterium]|nr:hypothetical protein [Rhizobiaceae bacterium]
MRTLLTGLLARSTAVIAFLLLFAPFSHAQTSSGQSQHWSQQESSLPGVKGGYHIVTTDPNRRDDKIGSSDDNGVKLGNWNVRTWGDISIGIGASSGNQKSGH